MFCNISSSSYSHFVRRSSVSEFWNYSHDSSDKAETEKGRRRICRRTSKNIPSKYKTADLIVLLKINSVKSEHDTDNYKT